MGGSPFIFNLPPNPLSFTVNLITIVLPEAAAWAARRVGPHLRDSLCLPLTLLSEERWREAGTRRRLGTDTLCWLAPFIFFTTTAWHVLFKSSSVCPVWKDFFYYFFCSLIMLKGTGGRVGCGVGGATVILKMEKRNATHHSQSSCGFHCYNDTSSSELETVAFTKTSKDVEKKGVHAV